MLESEHALALADAYPVVAGHVVVVPRKHVGTIYELTAQEQKAIWELAGQIRERLLIGLIPDGFSIDFTIEERGIIVGHACVHVVPRRHGDNTELPDGIEWVTDDLVPEKT